MPSWVPSTVQTRWLRAGLGRGTGELGGLKTDAQDPSIRRLVPLVYAVAADRLDPESRSFARNVVRATWVDTQMKLRQVSAVIAELQSKGIETCLLKGTGLFAAAYGGEVATRPINLPIDARWLPASWWSTSLTARRGSARGTGHGSTRPTCAPRRGDTPVVRTAPGSSVVG